MTMQLFKFQTNRLGFRPTARLPCSENTHLKATEKSLEQKFRVQNAKHLYNSFSTAGLRPMLKHSYFTGEPRRESRILGRLSQAFLRPVAFIWRHREPCLCPASSSLSGFSAFPAESLATADVPFRHFNFFFFFSCQYLSHLFPESAAAPKSASVTFRFEVFRTCLLGKHLPCLPAQTLTDFPSMPFRHPFSPPAESSPLRPSCPSPANLLR